MTQPGYRKYWERRLAENYTLQGVGYQGLAKSYNVWLYRVRSHVFQLRVAQADYVLSRARVLDLGSGTGFYINEWSQMGVGELYGADLTDIAVQQLQENFPGVQFYQCDIGRDLLSLPIRDVDIVSAMDVLFHLIDDQDYQQAIADIFSLLRPGGLFIFSENFLHFKTGTAQHMKGRSLTQIRDYLTGVGFELINRSPMFYLMNEPIDSQSRLLWANWKVVKGFAYLSDQTGWLIGAILFPIEKYFIGRMKEGPTTELMICRKPDR